MMSLLKKLSLIVVLMVVDQVALAKDNKSKASQNDDAYTAIMSTKYDFGDTNINAGMKAPDDFFLRGKQSQSLSQMVRLRSAFKRELRNSRSGVKALTR